MLAYCRASSLLARLEVVFDALIIPFFHSPVRPATG
jgi:hypothetical protein